MKRSALKANPATVRAWRDRSAKKAAENRKKATKRRIARRARIPARTADKAKIERAFARAYHSEAYVLAVKKLACSVPGCDRWPVDAAHGEHSKGASGDWRSILPLCSGLDGHHREQHTLGRRTFEAKYGLSLEAGAAATRRTLAHVLASGAGDAEPFVTE